MSDEKQQQEKQQDKKLPPMLDEDKLSDIVKVARAIKKVEPTDEEAADAFWLKEKEHAKTIRKFYQMGYDANQIFAVIKQQTQRKYITLEMVAKMKPKKKK